MSRNLVQLVVTPTKYVGQVSVMTAVILLHQSLALMDLIVYNYLLVILSAIPEGGGGGGGGQNGCNNDGDCDPGFICFNGLCIPKPCGTDLDCPDGHCVDGSCFPKCNDDDCPPGYICVEYNGNFVCMPIGEGGGGGGGGPQRAVPTMMTALLVSTA